MLNENASSLYEEMRNYTRGRRVSTPLLMLSHIFLRYVIDNRIGLVLDRNFDLYIEMARNLENPYHLYKKEELEAFLEDVEEALVKENHERIKDILEYLEYMYDEKENTAFKEILSTKSFRTYYSEFLREDFRDRKVIGDLLYTLSYQGRKDSKELKSYTLGCLISRIADLGREDLVMDELPDSELILSSIAIESDCRTITDKESLFSRLLSPLTRRMGKIEDGEKNTLLLTDRIGENLEEELENNERIVYFSPSALLLSSTKENLEKRMNLIDSGHIEAVIVLPSLSTQSPESISLIVLSGKKNEKIGFVDLNSKAKDREFFKENQLTKLSLDILGKLGASSEETEGISKLVSYEEVKERQNLVPMNYLESIVEVEKDTEELENRIKALYETLGALIEL